MKFFRSERSPLFYRLNEDGSVQMALPEEFEWHRSFYVAADDLLGETFWVTEITVNDLPEDLR